MHLTVDHGEKVGIVGPNGAGKTTLTKLMAGIFQQTRGRLEVVGASATNPLTGTDKTGQSRPCAFGRHALAQHAREHRLSGAAGCPARPPVFRISLVNRFMLAKIGDRDIIGNVRCPGSWRSQTTGPSPGRPPRKWRAYRRCSAALPCSCACAFARCRPPHGTATGASRPRREAQPGSDRVRAATAEL
ncbi:MAG: ATP-binding cassette domain-containing protein [Phycisphaerae bacterium]|nr:ATP-binding cassette domain-containing protein [Phycisphaerae bacterium]